MKHISDDIINKALIKQQVLEILHWDEDQFANFQYQSGLDYLEAYLPFDEEGQRMLQGEKLFWNWWKNLWSARDEVFVHEIALCPVTLATDIYHYLHSANELINEIKPSKVITGGVLSNK